MRPSAGYGRNLEDLLRLADENMYREKKRYYSQADAARKPES